MQRNLWGSTDEDEYSEQKELKFLCFKWNLEIIKAKGLKPKFTICLMFACAIISLIITTMTYGVATGFNYLNFFPIFFGLAIFAIVVTYELNIYQSKMSFKQAIILISIKVIAGLMGAFSIIYSLIFNMPFNNVVYFFIAVFFSIILPFWMACLSNDYEVPKFLKPYKKLKITQQNRSNSNLHKTKKNNQWNLQQTVVKKNNEWEIYLKRLWTSFITTVMLVDVTTDIFYGYKLIIFYKKSQFLLISGILLIICCVVDWMLMTFMVMFPGWVNHFAHAIAFIMELPNFILTSLSIWKIYELEIMSDNENGNQQIQLAILSIVTTSLNALIHIMYIIDGWAVKNAVQFLQDQ